MFPLCRSLICWNWKVCFLKTLLVLCIRIGCRAVWRQRVLLPQAVERLVQCADSGCPSEKERQIVMNCTRLLTRILPYIFEDADWRGFFWSTIPGASRGGVRVQHLLCHSMKRTSAWCCPRFEIIDSLIRTGHLDTWGPPLEKHYLHPSPN